MRACRRDTMSSTRTISRSLERPTTISLPGGSANSPPWYFPEMNFSAKARFFPGVAEPADAALGRGSDIVGRAQPRGLPQPAPVGRIGLPPSREARRKVYVSIGGRVKLGDVHGKSSGSFPARRAASGTAALETASPGGWAL